MGVTSFMSLPSNDTFAPDGNEVTFSFPCLLSCAPALPGARNSVAANENPNTSNIRRCWAISSSFAAFHANFPRLLICRAFWQASRGHGYIHRNCRATPWRAVNHSFSTTRKRFSIHRQDHSCNESLPFRHIRHRRGECIFVFSSHKPFVPKPL